MVDTVPPESAQNNAKRGLELRKEWDRGGTDVGVNRARQISAGKSLSRGTIADISSFARFLPDYDPNDKEDDGGPTANTIAVLLWGGVTGIKWAQRKLDEIDRDKSDDMETEIKHINIAEFQIKASEGKNYIEGYASTFGNVDSVNDIIAMGAFKSSIRKRKPKMLWQHKMDQVIGVYESIKEDDKGLFVKGRFSDTTMGRDVAELARDGAIDSMSIGFAVKEAEYDNKKGTRIIKEAELFEISLVTFPANDKALITTAKEDLPRTEREFEKFLRDVGYSRKQAKGITLEGFKSADGNQRDVELEALQNTFNQLIERITS